MQISAPAPATRTAPTSGADPSQPTLPGMEGDVIARYGRYGDAPKLEVKLRTDKPVAAPIFGAFDDAVRAANDLMAVERKAARTGLFKQRPGRVDSIAVLEAKDGFRLVRTDLPVDRFKEEVPGSMFWPQYWWVESPSSVVREAPSTLALVGGETIFDLRSGTPAQPKPFAPRG